MTSTAWNSLPVHDFPGGAANSTGAIESGAANTVFGWRSYSLSSATSGNSYGSRFQHYITGAAGSGAALRAYGLVKGVSAANLYGVEASAEVMSTTSSAISGLIAGVKSDVILNLNPGGTCAALDLNYTVASGKVAPATTASFIRVSNAGSGTGCVNLLNVPAPVNSSVFATHTTDAFSHSIRIVDSAGTPYYVMCTATPTNRGGGA